MLKQSIADIIKLNRTKEIGMQFNRRRWSLASEEALSISDDEFKEEEGRSNRRRRNKKVVKGNERRRRGSVFTFNGGEDEVSLESLRSQGKPESRLDELVKIVRELRLKEKRNLEERNSLKEETKEEDENENNEVEKFEDDGDSIASIQEEDEELNEESTQTEKEEGGEERTEDSRGDCEDPEGNSEVEDENEEFEILNEEDEDLNCGNDEEDDVYVIEIDEQRDVNEEKDNSFEKEATEPIILSFKDEEIEKIKEMKIKRERERMQRKEAAERRKKDVYSMIDEGKIMKDLLNAENQENTITMGEKTNKRDYKNESINDLHKQIEEKELNKGNSMHSKRFQESKNEERKETKKKSFYFPLQSRISSVRMDHGIQSSLVC